MGHLVLPTRWRALRCFWPDPGIRERQLLGPQRERTGRADDEEPVCSVRRSYHPWDTFPPLTVVEGRKPDPGFGRSREIHDPETIRTKS